MKLQVERIDLALVALREARAAHAATCAGVFDPESQPFPGASSESIARAEARTGFSLDTQHKALLAVSDGWYDFFEDQRLLRTGDMGYGENWDWAMASLSGLVGAGVFERDYSYPGDRVYPLSFSPSNYTMFLVFPGVGGAATRFSYWNSEPYEMFDTIEGLLHWVTEETKALPGLLDDFR